MGAPFSITMKFFMVFIRRGHTRLRNRLYSWYKPTSTHHKKLKRVNQIVARLGPYAYLFDGEDDTIIMLRRLQWEVGQGNITLFTVRQMPQLPDDKPYSAKKRDDTDDGRE
jgi:hypothetical protein